MSFYILKVKRINLDATFVNYAKEGDCGFDLSSVEDIDLVPGEKALIGTGLAFEIPQGNFGSIRDRSGLAAKNAIHTMAGVVDSGYRGEVKVVLINLGKEVFKIRKGDKIAQMVVQPYSTCHFVESSSLLNARGEAGFGSSG